MPAANHEHGRSTESVISRTLEFLKGLRTLHDPDVNRLLVRSGRSQPGCFEYMVDLEISQWSRPEGTAGITLFCNRTEGALACRKSFWKIRKGRPVVEMRKI